MDGLEELAGYKLYFSSKSLIVENMVDETQPIFKYHIDKFLGDLVFNNQTILIKTSDIIAITAESRNINDMTEYNVGLAEKEQLGYEDQHFELEIAVDTSEDILEAILVIQKENQEGRRVEENLDELILQKFGWGDHSSTIN